jgi:hypothetical protein
MSQPFSLALLRERSDVAPHWFSSKTVVLPPLGIGPPPAKLDRAMLRGVRREGKARETRAADVQERRPVFRGGARVPKYLHSYRIARAKSEPG